MLDYFQKFIKNEEDLQELEKKLNDYENLTSLVTIITEVFDSLTLKVDGLVSKDTNENYDDLERVVQKYEGEIRTHVILPFDTMKNLLPCRFRSSNS